jgi:peptidoglycan/xylan/chitin deacetylase (PgdA/CDA1 family)
MRWFGIVVAALLTACSSSQGEDVTAEGTGGDTGDAGGAAGKGGTTPAADSGLGAKGGAKDAGAAGAPGAGGASGHAAGSGGGAGLREAGPPVDAGPPGALRYAIDRSGVPALFYDELTLRIHVGTASGVTARADGAAIPVAYDGATGWAVVTTSGNVVDLDMASVDTSAQGFGDVTKAVLKDDKRWAWSHSFDDNATFRQHAIPTFEQYGYAATIYVIGQNVPTDETDVGTWQIVQRDIKRLVQKGWGIGNHTWSHGTVGGYGGVDATKADIKKCHDMLRAVVDVVLPSYRLMAFAAPMFDGEFLPIINDIRANAPELELMFDESGDGSTVTGTLPPELGGDQKATRRVDDAFDLSKAIGRWGNTPAFGKGAASEDPQMHIETIRAHSDATHHYWYNTFAHGADMAYPGSDVFLMVPWLHDTYGPGGTNEAWVATTEQIVSYLLVRDKSQVTRQ